ncbi:MAG: Ig-like domain-containing protein [Clostridia bacterium]|nr:Ig-like domain-containing protein [Clostridia bacterium]
MQKENCFKSKKLIRVVVGILSALIVFSIMPVWSLADENEPQNSQGENVRLYGDVDADYPFNLDSNVKSSRSVLRESVDLSESKYFPPIRCQQGGSCSAWATTYYQFTYQVAKLNNWNAKENDEYVASPKYVWNYFNEGRDQGTSRDQYYSFLSKYGCISWADFPQTDLSFDWYGTDINSNTSTVLQNALKHRVVNKIENNLNFAAISGDNAEETPITSVDDGNLNKIKEYLCSENVLTFSTRTCSWEMRQLDSSGSHGGDWAIGYGRENYPDGDESNSVGHSLTIVGYDDTVKCDINGNGNIESTEIGALLIANSWGTNACRHNNGLVWLMYDALNNKSLDNVNNPENIETDVYYGGKKGPRKEFIDNYGYYYMEVENVEPTLMVEVTVEQKRRNAFQILLCSQSEPNSARNTDATILFRNEGGSLGFDGESNGKYKDCMFVFDYGKILGDSDTIYEIQVTNFANTNLVTTIEKIRWLNANGDVLKELGKQPKIDNDNLVFYDYGENLSEIYLNKNCISDLLVGQSEQLSVNINPSTQIFPSVVWESSNTLVATVSPTGLVNCVGDGTANITCYVEGNPEINDMCEVIVDYADSPSTAREIQLHSTSEKTLKDESDYDYYKFTPTESGQYLFYTNSNLECMSGTLYNSSMEELSSNIGFRILRELTAGETYYIRLTSHDYQCGDFEFSVSKPLYSASVIDENQDFRNKIQMKAVVSCAYDTLVLTMGNNEFVFTKSTSDVLESTINGFYFKINFSDLNYGYSTIWSIAAKIPAGTYSIRFAFTSNNSAQIFSQYFNVVAYNASIVTGVQYGQANSLQLLMNGLSQEDYTLEAYTWENELINVTSTTVAATGQKIVKKDSIGRIVNVYFVVLYGDVTGSGDVGDGLIQGADALLTLQYATYKVNFIAIAELAADANHDGYVDIDDANDILNASVDKITIDQNVAITTIPDECYFLTPVEF